MKKVDSNNIAELDNYYQPQGSLVTKLPNAKSVRDFTEVFKKETDGTYSNFKMVKGEWVRVGSNVTTEKNITTLYKSGGSGTASSANIAINTAAIAANTANIAAFSNKLHSYTEQAANYALSAATGNDSKIISVKNTHASNTITISCDGAETIDGETTQDIGPDDCLTVMSNNTNWIII